MRILFIKTTSLGDIIHAFPALTELRTRFPTAEVEWVAEESFVALPALHPAVAHTHSVAWRRWRAAPLALPRAVREWRALKKKLRARGYDCIIDAQYLFKSALIGYGIAAPFHGLEKGRDIFAARFYTHHHSIGARMHAVDRIRALCAASLDYPMGTPSGDFGLRHIKSSQGTTQEVFLLPNTSKARKTMKIELWQGLVERLSSAGYRCVFPGHTARETAVVQRIAMAAPVACTILPPSSLWTIAERLARAVGVVSVDTGLAHLATGLGIPVVALFTTSNPYLFGCYGTNAVNLYARETDTDFSHSCLDIRHSSMQLEDVYTALNEKLSFS